MTLWPPPRGAPRCAPRCLHRCALGPGRGLTAEPWTPQLHAGPRVSSHASGRPAGGGARAPRLAALSHELSHDVPFRTRSAHTSPGVGAELSGRGAGMWRKTRVCSCLCATDASRIGWALDGEDAACPARHTRPSEKSAAAAVTLCARRGSRLPVSCRPSSPRGTTAQSGTFPARPSPASPRRPWRKAPHPDTDGRSGVALHTLTVESPWARKQVVPALFLKSRRDICGCQEDRYAHTHAHIYTHAHMHAHMHTHGHTQTHIHACTHMCTHAHI